MKFQFQLEGAHLNSNQWAFDNGYIEGDLQIYMDGQLYLTETYVNVVELATQLGKWLQLVANGDIRNFVYDSIDSDESLLQFLVQEQGMKVQSPIESYAQQILPTETIKKAVLGFLIELNIALDRIGYVYKLDAYIAGPISENTRALILLEQNEYDEAFTLMKKLASDAPSVQSLNNLAWFMLREEEDREAAKILLEEVLTLQPQSSFPYMMLGEIALHNKQHEEAKLYLRQANVFHVTEEATYNLAIAYFQLGEFEQAAKSFSRCEGESGMTQLHEVVSLLYAGQTDKAKALLQNWNEEADDYTGAIEITDVYVELGCYHEAREQFEKEWNQYHIMPYIVSRYANTLWQLQETDACQQVVQQAIQQKKEEIIDEQQRELDEHWSAQDREECIAECNEQLKVLEMLLPSLEQGVVPSFEYEMYPNGGCQLFGCMQHGHPEYEEIS